MAQAGQEADDHRAPGRMRCAWRWRLEGETRVPDGLDAPLPLTGSHHQVLWRSHPGLCLPQKLTWMGTFSAGPRPRGWGWGWVGSREMLEKPSSQAKDAVESLGAPAVPHAGICRSGSPLKRNRAVGPVDWPCRVQPSGLPDSEHFCCCDQQCAVGRSTSEIERKSPGSGPS